MTIDLKPAIVRILSPDGTTGGAGFVVTDDGLVATCAHVVEAAGAGPGERVRLAFWAGDTPVETKVLTDGWHPDQDVAFLQLAASLPDGVVPATLGPSARAGGHTFRAFGYPHVGDFQGVWAEGQILGQVTDDGGVSMLQLRAQEIAPGMSGAPVLDVSADRVVGMVTLTYHPDATLKFRDTAFAIPAEMLAVLCPEPLMLHPPESSHLRPLSVHPRTARFQHDHALIGRDADLVWLRQLDGDGLLVGQPGSGKTFLFHNFALKGGGLFVVSDDREDIAAFLSAQHPNVVMVDDAQVRPELLIDLKHIRAQLDVPFHILATCWPGDQASLMQTSVLPESRVRKLGLLTRDQIVEVIKAAGLGGPNQLIREIVNQAEGRPGLATTLAYLCLQGDVRQVVLGDALSNVFLNVFEPLIGKTARQVLAAFAVGGDAGMAMEAVAESLELSVLEVHQAVVDLAAGGVILKVDPQHLSVRPPALRHVLIRDVFFCGPTALPLPAFKGLLAKSPDSAQSVHALIGVKARGGKVPQAWLTVLVESSPSVWQSYVQLGREEAAWLFEHHPEALTMVARPGLESAPDVALPLLLKKAIGDQRPLHAHTDHPLRIIQDWVLTGEPGSGQPLERRKTLLQVVRSWLDTRQDVAVGLCALEFVLSPNFHSHTPDPGSGDTITIRRGLLSPDELRAVQELWPPVLEILQIIPFTDWTPVRRMVEAWVYPGRFNIRISSEASEATRAFAVQLLRDFVPLIESHPGLCHWAKGISGHLMLDFEIPSDEAFETLYPLEDAHDVDDWRSVQNQQSQAVRELAHTWAQLDPTRVLQDLVWIETEARLADINWPRWTPFLCREIAESTARPHLWVQLMLDTDLSGDLVAPFLRQAIRESAPGWKGLVASCLDRSVFQSAAISLILTHPAPPEDLLSRVLTALEGCAELVRIHCVRNEVSVEVLKRLLCHQDKAIVAAAVVGEWNADPAESVREVVLEEWEAVVITDIAEDFWLSKIFEKHPSLAYPWLQARLAEGFPLIFTHRYERAIQAATSVLNTETRSRLLHQLPDTYAMTELVVYLIGEDLGVYREFLNSERYKSWHLAPLSRPPEGIWVEMAKLALDAGYSSADIAVAARQHVGVSVEWGPESQRWADWVQRFERLCEHEDVRIREIGRVGRQQAEAMLKKALKREHDEAVYGWAGPRGLSVVE